MYISARSERFSPAASLLCPSLGPDPGHTLTQGRLATGFTFCTAGPQGPDAACSSLSDSCQDWVLFSFFFFFSFSGICIKLAFFNSLCIWSNDELYQRGMTEKTRRIKAPVTPPRLSFICFVGKQQVFKDFNPQHYNPPNKNKKGVSPGKSSQTGLNPSVRKGLDKYFPIGVDTPPSLSTC